MQEEFRIKDLKAASELIYYVIEEVSDRAIVFCEIVYSVPDNEIFGTVPETCNSMRLNLTEFTMPLYFMKN